MGKDKKELYEYQYTTPNKKVVKEYLPALKKPESKKIGKKKARFGKLFFVLGIFLVLSNIGGFLSGKLILSLLKSVTGAALAGFGFFQIRLGKEQVSRINRYERYVKALEHKKYASIQDLAAKVAIKPKYVIKDLEYMIQNQWFLEGHLDQELTQFMITDQVYEQYQLSLKGQKLKEEEEKIRMEQENDPQQKELNNVLEEGEAYIRKIHKLNDMILGDDISFQMDEIEKTLISIFDFVKRKPEKLGDLRKLMQYYLPMTIKILESYRDYENEKIRSKELEEGKKDIEDTLENVSVAFRNLREKLFKEDILDVSTDLDVLETMMSQEGLIDHEFSMKQ